LSFRLNEDGQEGKAFWQERFYDFNVYRSGKVKEKLNYMHANPVIRGLAQHPKDWPWSSWSFYFQDGKGLLPMDWPGAVASPRHIVTKSRTIKYRA
jgi:hypothetical protein